MDAAVNGHLDNLVAAVLARGDPAAAGFEVHYQPIVRLDDCAIVAVEALARWRHPVAGRIEPGMFVPAAERVGLIGVLDDFVLNRACADAGALADAHGHEVDLHVNVSASRLSQPDLDRVVATVLDRRGLRPGRLTIEITETSRVTDLNAAAACLQRIRERGVRFALDDFGSGFNTLAQLHALPVDLIKLDATLTKAAAESWRTGALCRSTLAICHEMGLGAIAEGIETASQALALRRMGCHLGQGYLYGRPVRLDQSGLARRDSMNHARKGQADRMKEAHDSQC